MSKNFSINELRMERSRVWEQAKDFLDAHRSENGMLSAEDAATYERMEADVVSLVFWGREPLEASCFDDARNVYPSIISTCLFRAMQGLRRGIQGGIQGVFKLHTPMNTPLNTRTVKSLLVSFYECRHMFKLRYYKNIGVFIFWFLCLALQMRGFIWKAAAISPILLSLFSVRENLPAFAGYSNHESWGLQAAPQARWCTDQRRSVHIQGRLIPTSG